MRFRRVARRAGAAATLMLGLAVSPVAAFELNGGCSVTVTSLDGSGNQIDTASGPGGGGTHGTAPLGPATVLVVVLVFAAIGAAAAWFLPARSRRVVVETAATAPPEDPYRP